MVSVVLSPKELATKICIFAVSPILYASCVCICAGTVVAALICYPFDTKSSNNMYNYGENAVNNIITFINYGHLNNNQFADYEQSQLND